MAADNTKNNLAYSKDSKILGPDPFDTRLRNQFLKTNKISLKDVAKSNKELPDDTEWATWVPLEDILKEDEESASDLPATH